MLTIWFWLGLAATAVTMFFSVVGYALGGFSHARLEAAFAERNLANRFARLAKHYSEIVGIVATLRVIAIVATVVFVGLWAINLVGESNFWAWLLTIIVSVIFLTVFAGLIPVAWARYAADSVLIKSTPVLFLCQAALRPVRKVFLFFDILVRRLAGVPKGEAGTTPIEEHVRTLVAEGERKGAIDEDEKQMIEGIFEFGEADASSIMTPRTDIVSIEAGASLKDACDLLISSGHSRIPVQEGSLDTIVGMLYIKDLFREFTGKEASGWRVKNVMRKAIFVPETKKLDELLREIQSTKVHIAIVLDEYGGTAGLVTIEDILEEIVGEIADEHETEPEPAIKQIGKNTFEVDARVHIDDLNEKAEVELPEDEDYETVGGFVFSTLGYIPRVGDVFERANLRFTVLDAEQRRINKLRIELLPPDS